MNNFIIAFVLGGITPPVLYYITISIYKKFSVKEKRNREFQDIMRDLNNINKNPNDSNYHENLINNIKRFKYYEEKYLSHKK